MTKALLALGYVLIGGTLLAVFYDFMPVDWVNNWNDGYVKVVETEGTFLNAIQKFFVRFSVLFLVFGLGAVLLARRKLGTESN